jgi:hypothetical protein
VHLQSLKDYAYKITLGVNAKIPYKERLMGKFKFMVDSEDRCIPSSLSALTHTRPCPCTLVIQDAQVGVVG